MDVLGVTSVMSAAAAKDFGKFEAELGTLDESDRALVARLLLNTLSGEQKRKVALAVSAASGARGKA